MQGQSWMVLVLLQSGADPLSQHTGMDVKVSSRRRAFSTPQIADHEPCKKVPTASDPSSTLVKNPLRKTHRQDLQQVSPEPWQVDFQVRDTQRGFACSRNIADAQGKEPGSH